MTAAKDSLPGERRSGNTILYRMVKDIEDLFTAGHRRLRHDLEQTDSRLTTLETSVSGLLHRVSTIESMPPPRPDVLKLTFSPPVVVFIVTTFLTVAGGMWTSTYSLRNDVAAIVTRMAAREQVDLAQAALQTERAATMQKAIDGLERAGKLQQIQIQELTNAVLDLKRSRP